MRIEAKNLQDALLVAAAELECSVLDLEYEVVQHHKNGILGLFQKNSIIEARLKKRKNDKKFGKKREFDRYEKGERKDFSSSYEGKSYENKGYEGRNFERKPYESKPRFEGKSRFDERVGGDKFAKNERSFDENFAKNERNFDEKFSKNERNFSENFAKRDERGTKFSADKFGKDFDDFASNENAPKDYKKASEPRNLNRQNVSENLNAQRISSEQNEPKNASDFKNASEPKPYKISASAESNADTNLNLSANENLNSNANLNVSSENLNANSSANLNSNLSENLTAQSPSTAAQNENSFNAQNANLNTNLAAQNESGKDLNLDTNLNANLAKNLNQNADENLSENLNANLNFTKNENVNLNANLNKAKEGENLAQNAPQSPQKPSITPISKSKYVVRDDAIFNSFHKESVPNAKLYIDEIRLQLDKLLKAGEFGVQITEISVYDKDSIYIKLEGEDAALMIGREAYRYKALSYLLHNWINYRYNLLTRLEIADFLRNQSQNMDFYLQGVIENVEKFGKAQTKPLDGVLVKLALEKLRERFPNKYVGVRQEGEEKVIVISDFIKRNG